MCFTMKLKKHPLLPTDGKNYNHSIFKHSICITVNFCKLKKKQMFREAIWMILPKHFSLINIFGLFKRQNLINMLKRAILPQMAELCFILIIFLLVRYTNISIWNCNLLDVLWDTDKVVTCTVHVLCLSFLIQSQLLLWFKICGRGGKFTGICLFNVNLFKYKIL